MKISVCFLLVILVALVLISGCGPSAPGPVPPTQEITTVATPTVAQISQVVQTPAAALTPSAPQATITSSTGCTPPEGWSPYTVKRGDTFFTLAKQVNRTPEELMRANCLASSLIGVGDTLYLPLESCTPSPPEGWRIYVVRSGDTLFSLAAARDTTVSEVKQVNCLVSDSLEVGTQLYLPPLAVRPTSAAPLVAPPPAPPAAPPAAPPSPSPHSPFRERIGSLPALDLDIGSPNKEIYKPCTSKNQEEPWISVETEENKDSTGNLDPTRNDLQHGQRAYYFACEFADPTTLTAWMSGPGVDQSLAVLSAIPDPAAQRVVAWNATCDLPTGTYTLTLQDGTGLPASLTFTLTTTIFERILTIPESAPAGTTFQVYYCGYGAEAGQEVVVDFYHGDKKPEPDKGYKFSHATTWNVSINASGWATQTLPSLATDQAGAYLLRDSEPALKGYDVIWLIR